MTPNDLPYVMRNKVQVGDDGCWNWIGASGTRGYPIVSVNRRAKRAHRLSFEALVGPIPDGLVIDHLCRNHGCVNPAHLEAVTQAENIARGDRPNRDVCGNGIHPWPESREGKRPRCGECRRARLRRLREASIGTVTPHPTADLDLIARGA